MLGSFTAGGSLPRRGDHLKRTCGPDIAMKGSSACAKR